ncbi:uncharacterized protein LOC112513024 [Cynara cardunculus var. scolymus]|uniref:uncharacterized protein LOC112513024 n=1 Tax=Cynara cardunculus var. scolymus TaxID=59895 RepID=UPI000D63110E|nr:uncharacterized protein LOC112513024 [Cynara cardunculus var. scolymus]
MEPPNFSIHNWVRFHSYENQLKNPLSQSQSDEDDDGEEALSLCDLANGKPATDHPGKQFSDQHQEEEEEDFDFNGVGFNLLENQMCSAEEVFFRGQILPFRHSVSLPSGFMTQTRDSVSFSRSESVSLTSSRSSSTRSHNSGTSGSNSPSLSEFTRYKTMIRNRNRNQFHSHPSPTPQIRSRSYRQSNPKPSPKWSFLQLGLLKPQEIGLADLKNRSQRSLGSMKDENKKKTTTKHLLLFGGCKCSTNTIESRVSWPIPMIKPTRWKEKGISKGSDVGRRKDGMESHRTSEWLDQLSLQET